MESLDINQSQFIQIAIDDFADEVIKGDSNLRDLERPSGFPAVLVHNRLRLDKVEKRLEELEKGSQEEDETKEKVKSMLEAEG